MSDSEEQQSHESPQHPGKEALILRRLPPSLSIDSAHTPTNRPLTLQEQQDLNVLNRLKEFLATAPTRWSPSEAPGTVPFPNPQRRPALNRFALPEGEFVTCVLWNGYYHITGTDIVRALAFRFKAFGRPVSNMKKFEEGIFSDLRNLKPGADACLEEPKVCRWASRR
jgi:transcription factor STE12